LAPAPAIVQPAAPLENGMLLFDANTLPLDAAPPQGLIKTLVYRLDSPSDRGGPIYFYVQGRLHAALLAGGYQSVVVCQPGLYHLVFSLKPLTDRELAFRPEQSSIVNSDQTKRISVALQQDTPLSYFLAQTTQDGTSLEVTPMPDGPSKAQRPELRQLHSVVRARVLDDASCQKPAN
jgi:hypothetical protein